MSRKAPITPATRALDALGLQWRPHVYAHDPAASGWAAEAAEALGVAADRVFKTLVAEADGDPVVAVVPASTTLDLKALAAAVDAKRAVMAAPSTAERRTGYVLGGISPLGQRTPSPLVLDTSAGGFPTIFVSGGRRGFEVELAPDDLLSATGGTSARVAVSA